MPDKYIDLTNIKKTDESDVYLFFKFSKDNVWLPDDAYKFKDGIKFTLSHAVIRRSCSEHRTGYRYELLNKTPLFSVKVAFQKFTVWMVDCC